MTHRNHCLDAMDAATGGRRRGVMTLAGVVAVAGALTPAVVAADCFAAADAITAGRWAEAAPLIEARLTDPACAAQAGSLRYSLAYANEKLAASEPARACVAAEHYAAVVAHDVVIADAAAAGRARMDAACRFAPVDGGAADAVAAEAPSPDRGAALGLTVGAGLAAVAGGALLYLGVRADGEREEAEAAMRAAAAAGSARGLGRAEDDFTEAADRATAFGLAGWGAVAVAAGLGVAATWAWMDDGPAIGVGAGQVGVSGRF